MKNFNAMIKICGLKDPQIAYQAALAGAHYIGLVFHAGSKRYVNSDTARATAVAAINGGAQPVAVCVDHTAEDMLQICRDFNIQIVQLHGVQSRQQHRYLPDDIQRIYVLSVNDVGKVENAQDESIHALHENRDYLLFDAAEPGSGKRIMTQYVQNFSGKFRYFIAGGLNADNVGDVMSQRGLYGVDVSSGVENSSGNKDLFAIKNFIATVNKKESENES